MKALIILTPSEQKMVIAKAISSLPEVKYALENGKILIKGGSTTSAIAYELIGLRLRVSGFISKTPGIGLSNREKKEHPHSVLISDRGKKWVAIDGPEGPYEPVYNRALSKLRAVRSLEPHDVIITGANAIDPHGNCALLSAGLLGGATGPALPGMMACGAKLIIACGLEKLIPTPIKDAIEVAGVRNIDRVVGWRTKSKAELKIDPGVGLGLMPIIGDLITEKVALEILGDIKCKVISAGGICGAGGATHLVIEGTMKEVNKVCDLIEEIKGVEEEDFVLPKSIQVK